MYLLIHVVFANSKYIELVFVFFVLGCQGITNNEVKIINIFIIKLSYEQFYIWRVNFLENWENEGKLIQFRNFLHETEVIQ